MALVARRTSPAPSPDNSMAQFASQIPDGIAAEAIDVAAPCYIDTDGRIRMAIGTTAGAAATKVRGFAARAAVAGQPVTLLRSGARFGLAPAAGMTAGADLFLAATAGRLDTAATVGGTVPIAFAINETDFMVL